MFPRKTEWMGIICTLFLFAAMGCAKGREYYVSVDGRDQNSGSARKPFKTISAAAEIAQPGDTITVYEGVYRERVNPPRGGESDAKRIIYQAAKGQTVVIKGSEVIKGWKRVQNDAWKVSIPNRFFGEFNPYSNLIRGDWFDSKGRQHHTGAVYLNEHWLTEAAKLEDVLKPIGQASVAYVPGQTQYLLNIAWFRPVTDSDPVGTSAGAFAEQHGIQTELDLKGGKNVGWIEHGDWVRYDKVDFGPGADQMEIRVSSATQGGIIEIRLNTPEGELLGTCPVSNTGGWHSWVSLKAKIKSVSGPRTICLVFKGRQPENVPNTRLWFAQVDAENTTIWAQFKDVNPNEGNVEINVRKAVFYPEKPGMNYITVSGFTMMHAATNWAPPTAEQVGLIGTHWSKGWIIENNDICYSVCTGLTLGKHGDEFDNTSANSAEGYVKTIDRALARGWSKEKIGGHIVRNNHISHCEQAGICGSMGGVFSKITGNHIHHIQRKRLFGGAETAGIKIHAPIDMLIRNNYIHHSDRGIWLDWMTQGARVSNNLCHDNFLMDLFVEVNHGPYVVDNNIFLSAEALRDWSHGGAFVHNLFAGKFTFKPQGRKTPYHTPHSTELAGLSDIGGGDNRFYNNIFAAGKGLEVYKKLRYPIHADGNVYVKGGKTYKSETCAAEYPDFDPNVQIVEEDGGVYLHLALPPIESKRRLVTTERLGKAIVPNQPYADYDGTRLKVDTDYFGEKRDAANPFPGPFAEPWTQNLHIRVWPKAN